MATIFIPTPLRKFTNSTARLEIQGGNVSEIIAALTESYPELKKHLINADGNIPNFINIFVDDDDIRNLQQEKTVVNENSVVSIVPAIAGGIDKQPN